MGRRSISSQKSIEEKGQNGLEEEEDWHMLELQGQKTP